MTSFLSRLKGFGEQAVSITREKRSVRWLFNFAEYKIRSRLGTLRGPRSPVALMVEPTNLCNLRCPTCPTGNGSLKRPKGMMTLEHFKQIIDEIGTYVTTMTFHNYGESFIHKEACAMAAYARSKGIAPIVSSNGTFFRDDARIEEILQSGFEVIKISIDGITQETYEQFRRGGKVIDVIEGARKLCRRKKELKLKRPIIELQMIVMRHNEHEKGNFEELAREIGADRVVVKSMWIDAYAPDFMQMADQFLPAGDAERRFVRVNGKFRLKGEAQNGCDWLYRTMVINWNGSVEPCCYDIHSEMQQGNIFEEGGVRRVWNNRHYQQFRHTNNTDKASIKRCAVCPEGRVDIFLE